MEHLSPSVPKYVSLLAEVPLEHIPASDRCCPSCYEQFIDAVEDLAPEVDEPDTMPGFRALPFAKYDYCDDPVITPCAHIFGKSCLIGALTVYFKCPKCHEDLKKDALRIQHEEAYIGFRPCDAIKPWHELSIHICISTVVIFPRAWKERFAEAWKAHLPHLPVAIRDGIDEMWPHVSSIVHQNFDKMAFMPLDATNAQKTPSQFRAFTAAAVPEALKFCLSRDECRYLLPLLGLCIAHVFKAEALKQLVFSVQAQLAYERAAGERDGAGTSSKLKQFMLSCPAYDLYNGISLKKMLPSNSLVDPKAAYATCFGNTGASHASIADYYRDRFVFNKEQFLALCEETKQALALDKDIEQLLENMAIMKQRMKDYMSRYQEALGNSGFWINEPYLDFTIEQEMHEWGWRCEDWGF